MRWMASIVVWIVLSSAASAAAAPRPSTILVLNESAMVGPFYQAAYAAMRARLNANPAQPASILLEHLELGRFTGRRQEDIVKSYLAAKYQGRPIALIVALGFGALDFIVRYREELWAGVPLLFVMVDEQALQQLHLPPNSTGRTARVKLRDSVSAAAAVVPNLRRLAIVGDAWEIQTAYRHLEREIPDATAGLEIIDLVGLPLRELRKRVATLPEDTAIIYTSIFSDGEGTLYAPVDALGLISEVANRPIVVAAETFIGEAGATGGYVFVPEVIGREAAALAMRILAGENASAIPVTQGDAVRPIFDWRQLQRWKVAEPSLPAGSEIRFREAPVWERYRVQIMTVAAVLLFQSALIGWLIYEHWRRHRAELAARNAMSELTQLNRVATAGALSASIAHEINQPLTAIAAEAGAALQWLRAKTPKLEEVRASLDEIVSADHRAGEIVRNLRAMFRKDVSAADALDINKVILAVLQLVAIELQKHKIEVDARLGDQLPRVTGQEIQLQQVVLNLIMNAVDAMRESGPDARKLLVKSERSESGGVRVTVEDSGAGIAASDLERVFAPLFTTKAGGMGMGLSICRSIVESHKGRIWASRGAVRGTVMQFDLPASQ